MGSLAALCVLLAGGLPPAGPDPVPIRRSLLPPNTPPPADPTARRMPRSHFELLVRAAARPNDPPRLTAASYKAKRVGNDLVGAGEWAVAGRGVLPLDPLRAAVTSAFWADGKPAAVFHPPAGTAPALWADRPGRVRFEWSARGTEEPGERRFDLRLPPAAVADLELELPATQVPAAVNADVLVTGPFPGGDDATNTWRLAFGGRPGAEFVVREAGGGQPPAFARAARAAKFALAPGLAEATIDLDLESTHGPADGWLLAVDPALRVTAVTAPELDGWQPVSPDRLAVRLRKPATSVRLTVTGTAPLPADGSPWACPLVAPAAGTVGDDALDLRHTADLTLDGWEAGDFRLVRTAPAADGGQLLSFRGTLTPNPVANRRPPSLRCRPAAAAFRTVEDFEWAVEPGRSRLTGTLRLTVVRGPLAEVRFRLPDRFTPSAAPVFPDDPAAGWGRRGDEWVLEPSRPLAAGQTAELRLDLRGPGGPPPGDPAGPLTPVRAELTVPRPVPIGATDRDGTLRIVVDDRLRGWLRPAADGFRLRYTGREPAGTLTVSPKAAVATAGGEVGITTEADRLLLTHTVRPTATSGEFGRLTLFVPDAAGVRWQPPTSSVGTVRPHPAGDALHLLGLLPPVFPMTRLAVPGRVWTIDLPGGSRGGPEVRTVGVGDRPADSLHVPLPTLLGVAHTPPEVSVSGEFDAAADADPWGFPLLTVRPGTGPARPGDRPWRFEQVERETTVDAAGASVVLRGRIREAAGPALEIGLPAGAAVESAMVDGRWVDAAGSPGVRLPVPDPDEAGVPFELRYRLPGGGWAAVSPPAELPGDPPQPHRWAAAEGVRLWPALAREAAAGDRVWAVPAWLPPLAGWGLAAAVGGLAVAGFGAGRRPAAAALVLTAAGLGAAHWAAPDGWRPVVRPPLVVGLLALPAVWMAARRPAAVRRTAAVALVLATVPLLDAQPPEPATVYLLPGPSGETAVVPAALFDKLSARAAPPGPAAVIVAAEYAGREDDGLARFDAAFTVDVLVPGRHAVAVPLAGVRLETMTLDGKPAYPDAAADRYTVQVEGVGRHTLAAAFAVPVSAAGADRAVTFTGPDVPAARVRFAGGPNARQLTAPARRGAEQSPDPTSLSADLGGGRSVLLRWRAGGAAAARPAVTVAEAAVWDVSESEATLTAAFAYRVAAGSMGRLEFDVPAGLEPGRVTVRSPDNAPNGVRAWRLVPGPPRLLVVDLQTPVEGSALVVIRFTPTGPPSARPTLALPRSVRGTTTASLLGVRLAGLTADKWDVTGLTDATPDALLKAMPGVPELALDRRPPLKAFRRDGTDPPAVRPQLRAPADPPPASHELVWTLGRTASVEGVARWPREATGPAVEFELPAGVTPTDVRAAELAGWGRTGNRVRAWFRTAVREPVVRWSGTWTGYPTDWPGPRPVELPTPAGVMLKVRPADGWSVQPAAGPREASVSRLTVFPPAAVGRVRVSESVERAGADLVYRAAVSADGGRAAHFAVAVADLPTGAEAKWDGPPAEAVDGRRWELTADALRAAVTVRLPAGTTRLPRAEVRPGGVPAADVERVLTVGPIDLRPAADSGARPRDAARWAVPADEPVRLVPAPPTATVVRPPAPSETAAVEDDTARRRAAAAGWVSGMLALAGLAAWGPRRLGPEYLAAFGLLAAAAGGVGLLALTVVGLLARVGASVRAWLWPGA